MTTPGLVAHMLAGTKPGKKRTLQDPEKYRLWKLRLEESARESDRAWMEWRYDHPIFIRLKATGEILRVIV